LRKTFTSKEYNREMMEEKQLLLLHGALGAAAQMAPLEPLLSDKFKVHLLDFSGHGGKKIDGPFVIDRFAYDVIQYLDNNRIAQVDIFGFSMGGYVAMKVAERLGLRIGKIMTLGTKFAWSPQTAEHEVARLDPVKIRAKVPAFADLLKKRHLPSDGKVVVRQTAALMTDLGRQPQWVPGVNMIYNQVRLMVGDRDNMVTVDETRSVAENLPNASLRIIPAMEHPFEKADPAVVAMEIVDFLMENSGD